MTSAGFSLSRLLAILAKELIQMRRDRLTFGMMLGVPLIQLLLFGFAINTDPKALPAALLAISNGRFAHAVASALENTGYYRFDHVARSVEEAENLIAKGSVLFLVTIPGDFEARVMRGDRPVLLIEADATDPAAASNAIATLGEIASTALNRELERVPVTNDQSVSDLQIIVHRRYKRRGSIVWPASTNRRDVKPRRAGLGQVSRRRDHGHHHPGPADASSRHARVRGQELPTQGGRRPLGYDRRDVTGQ